MMKLIGSKMEQDFRSQLIEGHNGHFSKDSDSRLKSVLAENGHSTDKAYILHWTPDQGEDFFTVLIEGTYLVSTELDRYDNSVLPTVERSELSEYKKGLSRKYQVQLLVAQELAGVKT